MNPMLFPLHPEAAEYLLSISVKCIRLYKHFERQNARFYLVIRNILPKINNLQIISKIATKTKASYINNFLKTTDKNLQEYLTHINIQLYPAGIYLLKVQTRTRYEICSKLTIKIPDTSVWYLFC